MLKDWVKDFSYYIKNILNLSYFRWFDSGDLPNILMLEKICEIADRLYEGQGILLVFEK